jgi:hypothetical protein
MVQATVYAPRREPADARPLIPLLVTGVAVLFALLLAVGSSVALVAVLGALAVVVALVWPRAGLHLIIAAAVFADTRITDRNQPVLADAFTSFQGMSITPFELLIIVTFAGVVARLLFDDQARFETGGLMMPLGAFLAAVAIGAGYGLAQGADMFAWRAEVRGFLYLPALYLIVVHTVRTPRHLAELFWAFAIIVNLASVEYLNRYFKYIRPGFALDSSVDGAFAHEDALLCAAAIIMLFARITWTRNIFAEWPALALIALPMAALLVMKRRAGIVALDGGLILLCLILLRDNIKIFLCVVPIAAVMVGLLLSVTWNEPGGKGQFARSFRTVTGYGETSARDQASDQYRDNETANVRLNVHNHPLTGLGFGVPYPKPIPMIDLSGHWPLWDYTSHNSVMWVWMKGGILAFMTMLALWALATQRAVMTCTQLRAGPLKAAAFSMAAFILMFVLFSWVDVGLAAARTVAFFGVTLGLIAAIAGVATREQQEART